MDQVTLNSKLINYQTVCEVFEIIEWPSLPATPWKRCNSYMSQPEHINNMI